MDRNVRLIILSPLGMRKIRRRNDYVVGKPRVLCEIQRETNNNNMFDIHRTLSAPYKTYPMEPVENIHHRTCD